MDVDPEAHHVVDHLRGQMRHCHGRCRRRCRYGILSIFDGERGVASVQCPQLNLFVWEFASFRESVRPQHVQLFTDTSSIYETLDR